MAARAWTRALFRRGAARVAQELLGCTLLVEDERGLRGGTVVETEAYLQDDPGSHSFRGRTARNASMWEDGGTLYVYRIYGVHLCANLATGREGSGEAVLLRALRPTHGLEFLRERRRRADGSVPRDEDLCRGPGNLARALGLEAGHDGLDVCARTSGGLRVRVLQRRAAPATARGPRIGLAQGADLPLRWFVRGERCVSAHRREGGGPTVQTA